jgi:hypothetical protein
MENPSAPDRNRGARVILTLGLLVLGGGGCVVVTGQLPSPSTPPPSPVPGAVEGVLAPGLVGCPGYEEPRNPWNMPNRIRVLLRVLGDGSVDPGSMAVDREWRFHRGGAEAEARALAWARECTFAPARIGDDPAIMETRVVFAFP